MVTLGTGFKPIQYLGNKSRLSEEIAARVTRLDGGRRSVVCDLFAGSGVVSRRLGRDQSVLAVDIQEYSRVLTAAQCSPHRFARSQQEEFLFEARKFADSIMNTELQSLIALERDALARGDANLITEIVENGSVAAWAIIGGHKRAVQSDFELLLTRAAKGLEGNRSATISRYYGGVYFGYEQAAVIDALAAVAYGLEPEARDTALAAVMSTASELVASVGGHFAQPIRITTRNGQRKQGALTAVAKKRRPSAMHVFAKWLKAWSDLQPTRNPVAALRADFRDVVADLPRSVGVVYADPPYTRDHYSRFYHVLETIARGDDPGISTATSRGAKAPSRGLYRTERHQSPFSVVSEAPGALSGIAEALAMRDVSLLLSYSPVPNTEKPRDRVMTLETVLAILEANFRHVQAHVAESVGHARFNVARLNTPMTLGAEVLISCTNS